MSDVHFAGDDFSWSNEMAQIDLNRDEYVAYRDQGEVYVAHPQGQSQPNRPDNDARRMGKVRSPRMGRTIGDFLNGPPLNA